MNERGRARANKIVVDRVLSIADANAVVEGNLQLVLHPAAQARCASAHARLAQVIAENRHVYGITTGFGPLANRLVGPEDGALLQQNLVHHLASGVGPRFPWSVARAMVLARLMSILQGASGASDASISALMALLNSDLAPCIPSRGTVGASGDLTPLAHMVLCFQGRGAFVTRDGARLEGAAGLSALGTPPLSLAHRDGLALVNGTSAMTGIALRNARAAQGVIGWAEALSAALLELLGGRAEAWDPALARLRPHPGQITTTKALNEALSGTTRAIQIPLSERQLEPMRQLEPVAGQDAYTLRCVPQVIGAVRDALSWHNAVLTTELSSATDNPLFPDTTALSVLHGGNFMGQHVGLVSDALATAIAVLAGLAERQIARVTDERLNAGLPAFLHDGPGGLNSGLMGAQVTATALLAEIRATGPASPQSISTNGANQDVVSMGTIAARLLRDKLELTFQIQAILALAIAQGVDIQTKRSEGQFSANALFIRDFVRARSARLTSDRPLGPEIDTLAMDMSRTGAAASPMAQIREPRA